ncbi:MAG: glycosyltransferase family 2 protein [Pseudomonadota bacterium]
MHFSKPSDDDVDKDLLKILYDKKIGIVVPCHNEQRNIAVVVNTLPDYVDAIVIVDDVSTDDTVKEVERLKEEDDRVVLIKHTENQGVGGGIASGYEWCRDNDMDAAVVMAGDAQMDPVELPILLEPVFVDGVNYSKGNRLIFQQSRHIIPGIRFFGNSVLSLLTKLASGYWHVSDSQCGYTVVDRDVLHKVDWQKMYKRYGQPNDLLVTLNIQNFRVRDVPVRPVYNVGEVSGIKIRRVVFTISNILIRRGLERLWLKYVVYDFHPLILFFLFGLFMAILAIFFFISVLIGWVQAGSAPILSTLALLFSTSFSINSFFFSMWMDMENNKTLR